MNLKIILDVVVCRRRSSGLSSEEQECSQINKHYSVYTILSTRIELATSALSVQRSTN